MQSAFSHFEINIGRARDFGGLHDALRQQTSAVLDLSDLLRAQLVLSVSALDHFVHELVVEGMLEIQSGRRSPTPQYGDFRVRLAVLPSGIPPCKWLEQEIRQNHGHLSFQQPDKIAGALKLVSTVPLWAAVATKLLAKPEDIKLQLTLIVDRRNKIAHEADLDPSAPGIRWAIRPEDAENATSFIEKIGRAIHDVL